MSKVIITSQINQPGECQRMHIMASSANKLVVSDAKPVGRNNVLGNPRNISAAIKLVSAGHNKDKNHENNDGNGPSYQVVFGLASKIIAEHIVLCIIICDKKQAGKMTTSCKATSGAADACKLSIKRLMDAIELDQVRADESDRKVAANKVWLDKRNEYYERLLDLQRAKSGHVWINGEQQNCMALQPYTEYDFWAAKNVMKKCSAIGGTGVHAVCTGTGTKILCNCDSGACKSGEGRINRNIDLQPYLTAWDSMFPEPYPGFKPYTRIKNFPNIVCQECTSCIEFSDITAGRDINLENINQAINCSVNIEKAAQRAEAARDAQGQELDATLDELAKKEAELAAAIEEARLREALPVDPPVFEPPGMPPVPVPVSPLPVPVPVPVPAPVSPLPVSPLPVPDPPILTPVETAPAETGQIDKQSAEWMGLPIFIWLLIIIFVIMMAGGAALFIRQKISRAGVIDI